MTRMSHDSMNAAIIYQAAANFSTPVGASTYNRAMYSTYAQ